MYRVRNIYSAHHVMNRAGIYYYVRRIPADLKKHYSVKRLCFSLRTKSYGQSMRTASSVHQRLEDYWLGLRLQQMDIPAIYLVKTDDVEDTSPVMMDAVEMYLSIKGKDDRTLSALPVVMVNMCRRCWAIAQSIPTHLLRLLSSETGALS